jgi:hypothetical protein
MTKAVWAIFWAIFSYHLVTLAAISKCRPKQPQHLQDVATLLQIIACFFLLLKFS